ncbi:MAG TPA: GNAT family N-acetyltransferase [Bacillota bacterium]|nr:GNAT family N-acetyltransferase [Bacillota bacterium]
MNIFFEVMSEKDGMAVMDIFNYYIENSFAAYPEKSLPYGSFAGLLAMAQGYPAYVIKTSESEKIIGFCFLHAYNPFPVFKETAEITCFLAPGHVGKGLGRQVLERLEQDAKNLGIRRLLASIASLNFPSLHFHRKQGFSECGRFPEIGRKKGTIFDVVWMEKRLM